MVNMPAVWAGLIERFGGRVPKLPNADRIIAEGAAWIAHDGLRLTLAKPIEVLVADGTGRGTYLPIARSGIRMPVENASITVSNCKFFCLDPRDGTATFEFAKPRAAALVQPSDDRETIPRLSELSPRQKEERDYYLPCSRCGRMLYSIRRDELTEMCERFQCAEFKSRRAKKTMTAPHTTGEASAS